MDWGRAELHLSGWRLVSASPALLIFVKLIAHAPGANPQLLLRGEHVPMSTRNPVGAGESFVNMGEINCTGGQERTLHATVYTGSDLQGSIIVGSDEPGAWTKIASDSLIANIVPLACADLTSASPPQSPAQSHPPGVTPPPTQRPR